MLENVVVALLVLGGAVYSIWRLVGVWRAITSSTDADRRSGCAGCSSCSSKDGCFCSFSERDSNSTDAENESR